MIYTKVEGTWVSGNVINICDPLPNLDFNPGLFYSDGHGSEVRRN